MKNAKIKSSGKEIRVQKGSFTYPSKKKTVEVWINVNDDSDFYFNHELIFTK